MGLKKGDIIDEFKRYPESCGLIVKVMSGGDGFSLTAFGCGELRLRVGLRERRLGRR
jgi:hypothetical protein